MGDSIRFNPSAFKHGVSETDILKAIETKIYEGPLEDYKNKYAIIGFDMAGNPIEIMYNLIDNETINIFHAMKCRSSLIKQIGSLGGKI
jgi:hypothetical protein